MREIRKNRERSPLESRRVYGNERTVDPRRRRTTSLNSAAWRASREREKRDGETARILFAIKARDNLKAITITHGLGPCTLAAAASPRSRTRSFFATWIVLRFSRRPPFPVAPPERKVNRFEFRIDRSKLFFSFRVIDFNPSLSPSPPPPPPSTTNERFSYYYGTISHPEGKFGSRPKRGFG